LFAAFSSVCVSDVIAAVTHQKSLAADLMPASVLKQVVDLLAAYFVGSQWLSG